MKPELLVVTPLPPAQSGIATYSHELLLGGLIDDWSVTVMVRDGEVVPADAEFPVIHASSHRWFMATVNPQRILHCIGNSEFHTHVPDLVARYGGLVLAHDVRMNGLHRMRTAADSKVRLSPLVRERHGAQLAGELGELERNNDLAEIHSRLDAANVYLFDAAVRGADRVAVHSHFAKRLADFELGGSIDVHVVPFGHRPPGGRREPASLDSPPVSVATFGMVAPQKEAGLLVDATAKVVDDGGDISLRFVGGVGDSFRSDLVDRAKALGVEGRVSFTGHLDEDQYKRELRDADIAIQLRAVSNGEASAAIADCLGAGLPTIVTDTGGQVELPNDVVRKLPAGSDVNYTADAILALVVDVQSRYELSRSGQRYAADNSFRNASDAMTQLLRLTPLRDSRES